MAIFSSIGRFLSSAYNTVKSSFSDAASKITGSVSQTANAIGALVNPNANKPAPPSSTVGSYSGTGFLGPTALTSTAASKAGTSNIPSFATPSNGYSSPAGPQLPVSISAGTQRVPSSGGSTSFSSQSFSSSAPLQSFAIQSVAPTTISTRSIGSNFGTGSFSSTGGQQLSLQSAPTSVNATNSNITGLSGALSGYKKYNASTGQYEDVPAPTDQNPTNKDVAQETKDLYDEILGKRPNINDDPEIIAARQNRQRIQEALRVPTDELNAVIAKQNQDLLQLRQTGAKEGVTEAVYGGQSNAINYNAAIRALPLQAQIAGLQGDLRLAQDYLTELTSIKNEQIKNQYEYNSNLFGAISSAITKNEQRTYEALKTQNERVYKEQQELIKTQSSLLESAVSQGASTPIINAINNAKTVQDAIIAAGRYAGNITQQNTNQIQYQNAVLQNKKLQNEVNQNQSYTGEYSSVVNAVSGLVGATKAPAVKQAISRALVNKDYATAYANIANAVEDSLTGTNKTKFSDSRTDIGVMQNMRDAINEYVNADGNVGYLKGSADKIAKRFGQLATDPKFASLGVQLEREFQAYRLAMTGAAFSPAESAEYAKVNPRTSASLDLNLSTIDGALKQLEGRVTSTINQRVPGAQDIYKLASGSQVKTIDYTATLDAIFK